MKGLPSTMESPNAQSTAHTYQDFADEATVVEKHQIPGAQYAPGPNDPFPIRLHWMLQQVEEHGTHHVVRWAPHGRAFVVHQRDTFVKDFLPV